MIEQLKHRLARWLVGDRHAILHVVRVKELEQIAGMTPEEFRMRYEQNKFAQKLADDFMKPHPLLAKIRSLRGYANKE